MNKYEMILIISNRTTENQKQEAISKLETHIANNGKIIKISDLGNKRLAYQINKQKEGYFYVIEFEVKPKIVADLLKMCQISEEFLKHMILRKDD